MTIGRWLRFDFLAVAAVMGILFASQRMNCGLVLLLLLIGVGLTLKHVRLFFSFFICFTLFFVSSCCHTSPKTLEQGPVDLIGKVAGEPVFDGDRLTVIVRTVKNQFLYGTYYIPTLPKKGQLETDISPGEVCHFKGTVEKPLGKTNPFGFDQKAYLNHKRIFSTLKVENVWSCQVGSLTWMEKSERLRLQWIGIFSSKLPNPLRGYVLALVFGTKTGFEPEDLTAFQTFGISHLLTVSGLHVGLVAGGLLILFRRMGVPREWSQILLLTVFLPAYTLLTGAAPSVLRASLMISVVVAGQLKYKSLRPFNSLIFVGLFLLFISPNLVYQLSFQLTFVVTFVIFLSWRLLTTGNTPAVQLLLVSATAEIGLLPITLYHFFQFSWLSMLANLIYVPFISFVILPLSFILVGVLAIVPSYSGLLINISNHLVKWPQMVLSLCANHSWATVILGRPNLFEECVLVVSVLLFLKRWETIQAQILKLSFPCVFGLCLILVHYFGALTNPVGRVVFLDVGQGDSIFIQLPFNRQTILIDTGGSLPFFEPAWKRKKKPFEVGRDIVLNELKGMGINKLDLLVLTHRDFDHIGGAQGIIGHLPIKTIMVSPYFLPSQAELVWLNKAKHLGTQLAIKKPGDSWSKGNAIFEVLWPAEKTATSNGTSLVLEAKFGGVNWLFTGDMEVPEEQKLLINDPDLKVDILKLGHHGSKTASSQLFLEKIQPKLAIISVGKHNRYGHPHQEVLNRLKQLNIPSLRTDQSGAITIQFYASQIFSIKTTVLK